LRLASALLLGSMALVGGPARVSASDPDAVAMAAEASAAYKRGDFHAAIEGYQRAYALRPEPTLLFNLGRCYEAIGTAQALRSAIEKYRAYLTAVGDVPDREAVERRVDALRRQVELLERPSPAPGASSASNRPVTPVEEPGPAVAPWIVVGVGVAGVALGGVLGAVAIARHEDAVAEPEGLRATEIQSDAEGYVVASNIALIAGGVVTAAGLVWGLSDVLGSRAAPPPAKRAVSYQVEVGAARCSFALRVDL
jgi:tetratricopeptide (TPR) repeat protein